MQVRDPDDPDDRPGDRREPRSDRPEAGASVTFRVPTRVVTAKFGLAAVLALAALALASGVALAIGLLAAAAVAAYASRDVLARTRLRADGEGVVTVRGYAGSRHLSWPEIERVRVDARMRLGARSELLELDAGEELYLFSRFDLGVDPEEARAALDSLRRRGGYRRAAS